MKNILFVGLLLLAKLSFGQANTYWEGTVAFPANYHVGDYIEFLKVHPIDAGASGNYEVSISYTRGGMAAAATHLASIHHSNPTIWKEVGRINSNDYVGSFYNFTIDCNTEYTNSRFRIRAVDIGGVHDQGIVISIKVRSINVNNGWTALTNSGNDLSVTKFLAMTNDWSLYVGNNFSYDGANIAIKAVASGNVGIGTTEPKEKLSVNGKVRAHEIKVEISNWPDYVFEKSYQLPTLLDTEKHIKQKGHLPGIPSAAEVKTNGVDLGEINAKLLQKIEELTLHLIEQDKNQKTLQKEVQVMKIELNHLKSKK